MKLSEVLAKVWDMATSSEDFHYFREDEKTKEMVTMYKQLYKEVVAVEKEGKDFNG